MRLVYCGVVAVILCYVVSVLYFLRKSDRRPAVTDPSYAAWAKRMEQARRTQEDK